MKRPQPPSPTVSRPTSPEKQKKAKVEGNPSLATVDVAADGEPEDGWTKVGKRKAKKARKAETKLDAAAPRLMYSAAEITKRKEAVTIADLRDLVLHLIADAPPVGWLKVENVQSVRKLVVLQIPGITPELLDLPPLPTSATKNPNLPLAIPAPSADKTDGLPFVASTFSHACPTRAPGDASRMHSVMSEFFQGPVSGEEKKRRLQERIAAERSAEKTPERYLLTLEQMIENDYPIPSYMADVSQTPPGWMETPASPSLSNEATQSAGKVYAIDCEMCLTEDGKELARVCVIDHASSSVVYDSLVKPVKPVTDYLTRWSGITAAALEPVTTPFEEAQGRVIALLSEQPTPLLLGHSLESDLKALKIAHPRCLDTAIMYHHPRGRPLKPGLAWLTKKWCGRSIQDRGEGGHDPEEDARACLELLKKKVENGASFGEFKTDYESIFERMSRSQGRAGSGPVRSAVIDHGNPSIMHGSKATSSLGCSSDSEVLEGIMGAIPNHHFVFGRFTALADDMGWITPRATSDNPAPPPPPDPSAPPAPSLPATLKSLDDSLARIHAALPPRTVLLIFTGHSDPRRMSALHARKVAFDNALRQGVDVDAVRKEAREGKWTVQDARDLEEEVEKARRGLVVLCVKSS